MKISKKIIYLISFLYFSSLLIYDFFISIRDRAALAEDIEISISEDVSNLNVIGITRNNDRIEFEKRGLSFISQNKYFKAIEITNFDHLESLTVKVNEKPIPLNLDEIFSKESNTILIQGHSESVIPIFRGFVNYAGDLSLALQIIFLLVKFIVIILLFISLDIIFSITYKLLPAF